MEAGSHSQGTIQRITQAPSRQTGAAGCPVNVSEFGGWPRVTKYLLRAAPISMQVYGALARWVGSPFVGRPSHRG